MPSIEHSPNNRASCQTCRGKIFKGTVRVCCRTREGANKYHHAECYTRGDQSGFYGFASLDPEARAAIIGGTYGRASSQPAAPPALCNDRFCAHGPGCPGYVKPPAAADQPQQLAAAARPAAAAAPAEQELGLEVVGWSWNKDAVGRAPRAGESLAVKRMPTNPRDKNALEVLNTAGQRLGFLPAALAVHISPAMDRGALSFRDVKCQRWQRGGY